MARGDENKATITLTLATLGIIGLAVFFIVFTKFIPVTVLFILAIIAEVLIVVPFFNINVFKMYGQPLKIKLEAFIPIWNYVMSSDLLIPTLIGFIVTFIIGLSCLVPDMYRIFGITFMLKVGTVIPNIVMISLLITNLLVGIGFYRTCLDIKSIYYKTFCSMTEQSESILSKIYNCIPFLDIILLSMPIFRMIPLMNNIEKTISISKIKNVGGNR